MTDCRFCKNIAYATVADIPMCERCYETILWLVKYCGGRSAGNIMEENTIKEG